MYRAIRMDAFEVLQVLLAQTRRNDSFVSFRGETLLHVAVFYTSARTLELRTLRLRGIDVDAVDRVGLTA